MANVEKGHGVRRGERGEPSAGGPHHSRAAADRHGLSPLKGDGDALELERHERRDEHRAARGGSSWSLAGTQTEDVHDKLAKAPIGLNCKRGKLVYGVCVCVGAFLHLGGLPRRKTKVGRGCTLAHNLRTRGVSDDDVAEDATAIHA